MWMELASEHDAELVAGRDGHGGRNLAGDAPAPA